MDQLFWLQLKLSALYGEDFGSVWSFVQASNDLD